MTGAPRPRRPNISRPVPPLEPHESSITQRGIRLLATPGSRRATRSIIYGLTVMVTSRLAVEWMVMTPLSSCTTRPPEIVMWCPSG